jgi:diguanylate cyclase (GGDEF)-like protein
LDVFTHLEESVLIFNSENELVDMNNSALQSYKIISSMKGMPIEKVCEAISIDKESKISDFTENVQGIYRTNNDDKWIDINSMAIKDENGLLKGRILIIKDITEDKKKQEEIEYLSFYDQLTGLYNRRFFEEELRRLDTPRNLPISIVIADLNGLKLANDAFGHVVGDKLLVKMAEILKKSCRSDDIIARMGGDEFVVILPKTNVNEVECVVNRISSAVNDIKIHSVMLSVAIGWEIKRHKDESMEEVLKKQRTLCIDVNCLTVLA